MNSMTGFGRGFSASDQWHATVEIHSLNRKQAEVVVQLPRELFELDGLIRKDVIAMVSRGRIQVSVNLERGQAGPPSIHVDKTLGLAFRNAFLELSTAVGHEVTPTAADYMRQPGIVNAGAGEIDVQNAWQNIRSALAEALTALAMMRESEGAHLRQDILARLATLSALVGKVAIAAPPRPHRQRELLTKRLSDAGLELDLADERLVRELAIFADRCDVSEELTRLDSHFSKFREYMDAAEPPGRALDFLCQELFRELNTIGSKANDAGIAQTIVEAKTELEKIREQVQNVE